MARIVFCLLPHHGHLNPAMAVARRLEARGHETVFVALNPEAHAHISRHGYAALASYATGATTPPRRWNNWPAFRPGREAARKENAALAYLARARSIQADLCVSEIYLPQLPVSLFGTGVPVVQFCPTLWPARGRDAPPFDTLLSPRPGRVWSRLLVRGAWNAHGVINALRGLHGLATGHDAGGELRRLAKHTGFPLRTRLRRQRFRAAGVDGPTLVAYPREFDFPVVTEPGVRFVGPCIFQPDTKGADWTPPGGRRPLVYVSFGTLSGDLLRKERVFAVLREACGRLPDHDFVIGCGDHRPQALQGPLPKNMDVHDYAPQPQVLARAAAFITHAGLNSVKEAVWHGVPMLAMPWVFDQFGAASRLKYHGLGLWLQPTRASAEDVVSALKRLIVEPSFRERSRHFQTIFREAEARDEAADFIASHLPR